MNSEFQGNALREEHIIPHLWLAKSKKYILNFNLTFIRMFIYGGHDIKEGSIGSLWMIDLGKLNDNGENSEHTEKKPNWIKIETHGKD